MPLLDDLNERQRQAVMATAGPLLVLAGAGSGKTRVITYRIAYLIDCEGVAPQNILAVTFTNKAADEMRQRVRALLGRRGGPQPWISTFHSLCVRLLRRDGPAAGIRRDFTIYDEDDQAAVVKKVMKELGLEERVAPARGVLARISHAKNHGITPQQFYANSSDPRSEQVAVIYERYQQALRRANALDFDDLLLDGLRLLATSPETADKYTRRFRHVLVDEYQDTNRIQYELVWHLSRLHRNLCVVGDEDQSIYGWRGADLRNILEFEKDFPEARTIRLEQNYRSTKAILAGAGAVVAHNVARKGKTLWTENPQGEALGLYEAPDGENEALFVADQISRCLRESPEGRVAVLYRMNAQSRLLEEAMRRYALPYHIVGGFSFYERAEIRDLISYLKLARNPEDSLALLRIINTPPRSIGKGTTERLERYALENSLSLWNALEGALRDQVLATRAHAAVSEFRRLGEDLVALAQAGAPVTDLLRAILDRTRYLQILEEEGTPEAFSRVENIQELLNAAQDAGERGETLSDFLDHAALVTEADDYDERARVSLMTLHAAKGLEFPVVFIVGLEEGVFPHSRSMASQAALEEERRLCYVGMTRAQQRLILTRADYRRRYGTESLDPSEPSRFLSEVPAELLENMGGQRRRRRRVAYSGEVYNSLENIAQFFAARGVPLPLKSPPQAHGAEVKPKPSAPGFQLGQRVRHAKYGVGLILRREGQGDDAKVTVSFPGYGLRKLVEKYARLEKV